VNCENQRIFLILKAVFKTKCNKHMVVLLATLEDEARESVVQGQPGKYSKTLSQNQTEKEKN
jgi:hypothetical protein